MPKAGLEDRARLVRREHAVLAEHVAPFGQRRARSRDHLVDDERDVARAGPILDRHLVRAHERRRDQVDGLAGEPAIAREACAAPPRVEAVAALGLPPSSCQTASISASRLRAAVDQIVFAGRPRRGDGLDDAAARAAMSA